MSSYQGNNTPYDPAAPPVWNGASASSLPQAPLLGSGYSPQQHYGVSQPQVVAPQFFDITQTHQQAHYQAAGYETAPAPAAAVQYQQVQYVAPAAPAASVWQPRYVPSTPAASSSFVPPLVRRDGVFGLAVGLLLIVLIFATALALQAKMPGYAPAAAAYARPAAAVVTGGGAMVGPIAPAAPATAAPAPAATSQVVAPAISGPTDVVPPTQARAAGGPQRPSE